jgi:protein-tyrosine phosphatase
MTGLGDQDTGPVTGEPDRFLRLDGCFNFRDVGGYPTVSGRPVRRGKVYRSDALHRLTARGMAAFSALQVATVIDLRTPATHSRV